MFCCAPFEKGCYTRVCCAVQCRRGWVTERKQSFSINHQQLLTMQMKQRQAITAQTPPPALYFSQ